MCQLPRSEVLRVLSMLPLLAQLVSAAESGGFRYDARAVRRADPNKRRRWLIPVILAAQVPAHLRHQMFFICTLPRNHLQQAPSPVWAATF